MSDFVHLHNHTHYSLLDAACTPKQLLEAARDDGHHSLALTDHGVMFGAYEFYLKAKDMKIKPIIGFEAYVANGSRFDKTAGKSDTKKRNYFHLVLLAKNSTGYKNLCKLTTRAHTEGFYYKPRIDEELLRQHSEGLIALSACIIGVVNAHLVNNDYETARQKAAFYHELFGDDFYIEIQDHGLEEDKIILRDAPKIAGEFGIKLIGTNDVHYCHKEDAYAHNVHLLIKDANAANSGTFDIKNLRYKVPEMYFKTKEQMNAMFAEFPEAVQSTLEVADKCSFSFDKKLYMPEFEIPKESNAASLDDYMEELTYAGIGERYPEITDEVKNRTDYELSVIRKMGFAGYFLIVQDFINAARRMGVRVGPGRGSAAGSIVAYALGITNVDPLKYNLLFERFLNPERVSMPDIDIDFSDDKREMVIEYCREKYGSESVSQIITFGKLSTKAVLKDVGRVLGIHYSMINDINSKIPSEFGKVKPLAEAIELPELKWLKESEDTQIKDLINYSKTLEGFVRNTSLHAAGVVIAPGPVDEFVPLYLSPNSKSNKEIATQYSMKELEKAGLLKMDFLGLRTLSIIENALEMIEANHGIKIDIDKIDFDDKDTYEMISHGHTLSIFQFESNGMQEYLKQLKPANLEELTAMNALYRPGPMENIPEFIERKHGRKKIEYLHPVMENSLKTTYGIIVYQEQVMQLGRDVAGFSLGQADILRRAMGKKDMDMMDKMKVEFLAGAKENGIDKTIAGQIWDLIFKFANYGFNKSHSLAYSYLAFQTAWLKTHYPAEFLAANMTAELNDQDKIVELIDEAKIFNITVLPPDINLSNGKFKAVKNEIYFSLAAIKNVGSSIVEYIAEARKDKPFTSFYDCAARVGNRQLNRKSLESLICAGAFDSLNPNRASLMMAIDSALDYAKSVNETKETGMESLFGEAFKAEVTEPQLPNISEWHEKERLQREKDVLNFYLTGHPLNSYLPYLNLLSDIKLGEKGREKNGMSVKACGLVTNVRTKLDKNNNTIAFIMLEDFSGKCEVIFWSEAYAKSKDLLSEDAIIIVYGKVQSDDESLRIVAEYAQTVEVAAKQNSKGYNIWIDLDTPDNSIEEFHRACTDINSENVVLFNVYSKKENYKAVYAAYNVNIGFSESKVGRTIEIFGKNNVRLLRKY